jgi:hypothetical protein
MSVSGSRFRFVLFAVIVIMCGLTLNVSAATKRKPKLAKQAQSAPAPAPAIVEVPPPAELTLEQKPAVPPTVTYRDRQLTIVAENSSLGDVLRAVKTQTGASIDLPANTNARVVTQLGPGPSRDVLAQLLNGTLFNYVLLGTVNDPFAVGKIILIPKPVGGPESAANVQPNQPQPNYPAVNVPNQNGEETDPDVETNTATEEDNTPAEPEQPAAQAPNGAQQPNLRTPEQLLQELQRQQQLQQQLQQQQGTSQPNQQQPEQNPQQ